MRRHAIRWRCFTQGIRLGHKLGVNSSQLCFIGGPRLGFTGQPALHRHGRSFELNRQQLRVASVGVQNSFHHGLDGLHVGRIPRLSQKCQHKVTRRVYFWNHLYTRSQIRHGDSPAAPKFPVPLSRDGQRGMAVPVSERPNRTAGRDEFRRARAGESGRRKLWSVRILLHRLFKESQLLAFLTFPLRCLGGEVGD